MSDDPDLLTHLMPAAIEWVEALQTKVLADGRLLNEFEVELAKIAGVQHPEHIRLLLVETLPRPHDQRLRDVALAFGMLGPEMTRLTVGYGILITQGALSPRLLSHECRHVFQYEQAGSVAAFLPEYLRQVVEYGYYDALLEQDARANEYAEHHHNGI